MIFLVARGLMAQDLDVEGGIATNISSGNNLFQNTFVGQSSDSNSLTVENPGTVLSNSQAVYVGSPFSQNSLIVTNGAAVSGSQILVGSFGGNSNALTIAGAGTVTAANFWVGYQTGSQNSAMLSGSGSALNVTSGDHVWIGDEVMILSLAPVAIASNVCISQRAFLCTGSHRFHRETFDLVTKAIVIEEGCWVAANVFIAPGVTLGSGTRCAAGAVVLESAGPNQVLMGNPATTQQDQPKSI
jgi:T5SS/PEP-CTERM-associated repeat protein